jgi:hypothetical protein
MTTDNDYAARLEAAYNAGIEKLDSVFQVRNDRPEPLLPDFLRLGECKFEGVVKLAREYLALRSHAITPKELPTVLAALRHWQDLDKRYPALKFVKGEDRSGTHFEEHDPLTVEEIDALCERLNCSPEVDMLGTLETLVAGVDEGQDDATIRNYITIQARAVVASCSGR